MSKALWRPRLGIGALVFVPLPAGPVLAQSVSGSIASPLPSEFLRPFRGYQNINIRSHFGTSDYNALQVQVNRRW